MPRSALLFGLCCALSLPAAADAQGSAVTLRAGTQGVAAGFTRSLTPGLNARLDVPYFTYARSSTQTIEDFNMAYDAQAKLLAVGAVLDWYPFGNFLRLAGGAYLNDSQLTVLGRSADSYTVGSVTYSPDDIGLIDARVRMGNQIAPYLGIGIGNPVKAGNRVGFVMDMGMMYTGGPRVEITGTRMLEPMSEQAPVIQGNLAWAKWFPVVSMGLSVKLF